MMPAGNILMGRKDRQSPMDFETFFFSVKMPMRHHLATVAKCTNTGIDLKINAKNSF